MHFAFRVDKGCGHVCLFLLWNASGSSCNNESNGSKHSHTSHDIHHSGHIAFYIIYVLIVAIWFLVWEEPKLADFPVEDTGGGFFSE